MDDISFSQSQSQSKSAAVRDRRVWKPAEEVCLLNAMKDFVAGGWKADNEFKMGYLNALEQAMNKQFPGTDLKGDPHIKNKQHVWKKHYGIVCTMLDRSGFGWNDTSKTIDVPDDDVWAQYVLAEPKNKGMRYKRWPFYNDWVTIFGKDRATGGVAKDWYNAVNGVMDGSKDTDESPNLPTHGDHILVDEDDNISTSIGESNTSKISKQGMKRKRGGSTRQNQSHEDPKMVELMSTFFTSVHAQIGTLVSKVGHDHDVSQMRKNLFDALEPMSHLTVDEKLDVQKVICSNAEWVDIFYGLSPENKVAMVSKIVNKLW